ncbi:MAG: DUF523 domain-containing protein [Deltaproteobacteria bacterium]|nr:DUF523 domain-containing protein [Deltaproteobacteria bacterium]
MPLRGDDEPAVLSGRVRVSEVEGGRARAGLFLGAARRAVEVAHTHGAALAVLKERSPSCGCRQVWRDGARLPGRGVAAEALARSGMHVVSDEALRAPPVPAANGAPAQSPSR